MKAVARHAGWLFAALGLALFAVLGPIDALADRSFAWHMLEHVLLILVVPLFVLLGHPGLLLMRALPARAGIFGVRLARSTVVRSLTSPPVCLALFIGVMWGSHYSGMYEAALEHPFVHIVEHGVYLAAGVFFWLPVVSQPPLPVLPFAGRLFYLFAALPQCALVAFTISDARAPLYPYYVGVLGSSALADQRNAAAFLWIAGGALVLGAILTVAAIWAHRERAEDADWRVTRCALP